MVGKDGPRGLSAPDPGKPTYIPGRPQEAIAQNAAVSELQGILSMRLGAPVIDATNIKGNYSFALHFCPMTGSAADSDSCAGPSIVTALQEQLGLKLEKTTLPVLTFVIDHIDRPNVN